ncbi:hypothetical protein [Polyangium fumosum]|uniref:DUF3575 domain-containing protein n=1 Tax=Polyangium fumosum TaxID=889272 RepID=A0A4U1J837_9BACT|nr:hypothetical protein [Polyangium fumosum]TKD03384.1 hypothetical protein E8A74_25805 [Polyangium fumosum]
MRDASSRSCKARLLLVAALACGSSEATAQPSQVLPWRLDYAPGPNAPKNCPDKSYIKTALATKLKGHDPFTDDAPRSISVKLVLTAQRIEAHIEARDENGEVVGNHVTHAESWRCDQLADRTVFYLRDIVDPVVLPPSEADAVPNSSAPPASSPPPLRRPPAPPPSRPAAKPPMRSPWLPQLAVSASAGAAWWSAPKTALSLAVGLEARWPRFSVGVEGYYDHAWELATQQDVAAERAALAALACFRQDLFSARAFARACLFGDVALLLVDAQKIKLSDDDELVFDLGARVGVGFWLARFLGLELHGDVACVPRQPAFVVDGEKLWRSPGLNGAVRLGLVVPFDIR